jgi:hypothetical protein
MSTLQAHRKILAAGACGFAAAAILLGTGGAAHAAGTVNMNDYSLVAEGDGFYVSYSSQGIPAVPTSNFSPYAAQSKLGSGGNSTAFAGAPYLGPQLQTLSSLVSGLSGARTPPIPPVPGYATSDYPATVTASESNGPYLVQSNSAQFSSNSEAAVGVSGSGDATQNPQIFSESSVVANDDGSVASTASAGVDGLSIGGIINALNISSSESLTVGTDGTPKLTTTGDLGTFTVLGFKIGVDSSGFNVLGDSLPLPTSTILAQVNSALSKSGIGIAVLPATTQKTAGQISSATSGALEIKIKKNVPALGPTTVDEVFGRSTVTATDTGTQTPTTGSSSPPASTSTTPTTGSIPSTGGDTGSVGGTGGSVNLPPVGSDGANAGAAAAPVIAPPATNGSGAPTAALGDTAAFGLPGTGHFAFDWYLALVLAGAGIVVGSQVFRAFGIRLLVNDV